MWTLKIALVRKQNEFDALQAEKRFPHANRAAFNAVGAFHVKTIIPRHFKGNAKWVYGYSARKPAYLKRKYAAIARATRAIDGRAPTAGEKTDLVYTGSLKREAIGLSSWSATKERGKVTIRGRVLNISMPPNSSVDMRREMTTMTQGELEEVETIFTDAFAAAWEQRLSRARSGVKRGRPAKATVAT